MIERSTTSIMAVKTVIMIVQIYNGARGEEERVRRRGKEDTVRVQVGYSRYTVRVQWGRVRIQWGYIGAQWGFSWGTVGLGGRRRGWGGGGKEDTLRVQGGCSGVTVRVQWGTVSIQWGYIGAQWGYKEGSVGIQWGYSGVQWGYSEGTLGYSEGSVWVQWD